ncbi:hypothetical protein HELRODRAFT_161018 [Helobdella robusta]|uniref:Uncharacterized protein n=1 Tax=Helobdella robusta TaxID=6412 RepID=T1ER05_HELRO|nr:hypothetical protein HELRODRAFT_161018 [Helobdella robusta]ESO01842.1 hypothetical protein HELRODRAFT_161018 [Helobdella robusta]
MHNQLKLADNPASDVDATLPTSEQQPSEPSNNSTSTSSPSPTESIESTLPGVKLPKTSTQWALTILSRSTSKDCGANLLSTKISKSDKSCGDINSTETTILVDMQKNICPDRKFEQKMPTTKLDSTATKTINTLQRNPSIIPRNIYNSSQVQS